MVSISASGGQLVFAGEFKQSVNRRYRMAPRFLLTHHAGCILAAAILFVCVSQTQGAPPKPAELDGLMEACEPLGRFIAGCTISVGNAGQGRSEVSLPSSCPLPSDARVLAYEENRDFICVFGEFSTATPTPQRNDVRQHKIFRRFICLKPSLYVIDDIVELGSGNDSVQWQVRAKKQTTPVKKQATMSDFALDINDGQQVLACRALWPECGTFVRASQATDLQYRLVLGGELDQFAGLVGQVGAAGVFQRSLQIWCLCTPAHEIPSLESSLNRPEGSLDVSIATRDRSYHVELTAAVGNGGWISIQTADGEIVLEPRPLPGGVLPHGPQGTTLIERWDRAYRDGRQPPWDTGSPASDLVRAVEEGAIKPCRTVVLGCGSGTNAIYLAQKGFDVTAVDVAPTALSIARRKAERAGVRVDWVLADVLHLPDLESFDLVFDRGCYHNVRYVDAAGFVASLGQVTKPGSKCLILSCNRDGPPGVREHHMREDFSELFEFRWLRESDIQSGRAEGSRRPSWSVLLERKGE